MHGRTRRAICGSHSEEELTADKAAQATAAAAGYSTDALSGFLERCATIRAEELSRLVMAVPGIDQRLAAARALSQEGDGRGQEGTAGQ